MKVHWFGQPGHFILARACRWHLHAHVGRYCVTGVGELMREDGTMETLGGNRFYEVMVFDTRRRNNRWSELISYPGTTRKGGVKQFMKALAWAQRESAK